MATNEYKKRAERAFIVILDGLATAENDDPSSAQDTLVRAMQEALNVLGGRATTTGEDQ